MSASCLLGPECRTPYDGVCSEPGCDWSRAMPANDHQVGGDHYKIGYEHWDWLIDCGLGYFEGQATKYIARWHKKGGLEDLRKALHYIQKLRESQRAMPLRPDRQRNRAWLYYVIGCTERFKREARLTNQEFAWCLDLATWLHIDQLYDVYRSIDEFIVSQSAAPVPLEDSNKHAERA